MDFIIRVGAIVSPLLATADPAHAGVLARRRHRQRILSIASRSLYRRTERRRTMPDPLRIGVVGCARILPAHLRGMAALRATGVDSFRVTALCARERHDAEMFRRRGE